MSDRSLEDLAKFGALVNYENGRIILVQGAPSDALYLLLSGEAHVYFDSDEGGQMHLKTLQAGDHFGEIGVLEEGIRTANVKAHTDCSVFKIDCTAFEKILKVAELAAPLLLGLSRSLALRLALLTRRLADVWSIKNTWAGAESAAHTRQNRRR
jgi:CRP-like cAMP-binding protein